MKKDTLVEEIRDTRKKISREHGNDTRRLVEFYQEMEKKLGARVRTRGKKVRRAG
jgi:hypothetical protein